MGFWFHNGATGSQSYLGRTVSLSTTPRRLTSTVQAQGQSGAPCLVRSRSSRVVGAGEPSNSLPMHSRRRAVLDPATLALENVPTSTKDPLNLDDVGHTASWCGSNSFWTLTFAEETMNRKVASIPGSVVVNDDYAAWFDEREQRVEALER